MRIAIAIVLLAGARAAVAGCCSDEPSALDRQAGAQPLRVARDEATREILLTWESSAAQYRVFQGDVDALHATGSLNDAEVATPSSATWLGPEPAGNAYYLVSTLCGPLKCSRGRDSLGREREIPGCTSAEGGRLYYSESECLLQTSPFGVVTTTAEHDTFAACFTDPSAAPPMRSGMAIAYALDEASVACGTCLEFTCVALDASSVTLWYAGLPVGDCDALHAGGPYAYVPLRPAIRFRPVDPTPPSSPICP